MEQNSGDPVFYTAIVGEAKPPEAEDHISISVNIDDVFNMCEDDFSAASAYAGVDKHG